MSDQTFAGNGVILENLPNTNFRVRIDESQNPEAVGKSVLCTLSGKMRMNWVRLLPGDKVKMDISSLDPTRGRIVYRIK